MSKLLTDKELEEMFDTMLDSCYSPVKIGLYEYSLSVAFKAVDPIAYRQDFLNWLDNEVSEGLIEKRDEEHYA